MVANVWLNPPVDGTDKVGERKADYLDMGKVRSILVEFVKQLDGDEWIQLHRVISQIAYISDVYAAPPNRNEFVEWWTYYITARFDNADGIPALVLHVKRYFRSQFFGLSTREIWVRLDALVGVINKIHGVTLPPDILEAWNATALVKYKNRDHHRQERYENEVMGSYPTGWDNRGWSGFGQERKEVDNNGNWQGGTA